MSVKVKITSATTDDRYFLEIPGHPGRIYLEGIAFGAFNNAGRQGGNLILQMDGHASAFVQSPAHLLPEMKSLFSPLCNVLRDYWNQQNEQDPDKGLIPMCWVGAEWSSNGTTIRRTKYRFYNAKVVMIYERKNLNSLEYTIEFRSWA